MEKKIPLKNYIILIVIFIVFALLVFYMRDWYNTTREYFNAHSPVLEVSTQMNQEELSNCYGYWLASPSAYNERSVMSVLYDGCMGDNIFYSNASSVRPLVCLNSEVTATQDESTLVWKLSI